MLCPYLDIESNRFMGLKGQYHEIFECFLTKRAPPGPIRGTLGQLRFFLNIHGDIRQNVGLAVYV